MQPTSFFFFAFALVIWLIYLVLPRKLRCLWLLLASYAFCLSFSVSALMTILFTTLVSWAVSLVIEQQVFPPRKHLQIHDGFALLAGCF